MWCEQLTASGKGGLFFIYESRVNVFSCEQLFGWSGLLLLLSCSLASAFLRVGGVCLGGEGGMERVCAHGGCYSDRSSFSTTKKGGVHS